MKKENYSHQSVAGRSQTALSVRGLLQVWCLLAVAAYATAATPGWSYVAPSRTYGLFRHGSTTVYDPVSNELVVFAGSSADEVAGNPHVNDVWTLSNANGLGAGLPAWTNLIPNGAAGSPSGRHNATTVYDSVNNRMIMYGGCAGGCYPLANDLWVLINANGQGGTATWQQLSPIGAPPARAANTAVYDSSTNSMIIFGGQNGGGACGGYNDVWVLSNANGLSGTPTWNQLVPTGAAPLGDYYSSAAYDSTTNTMMLFGGSIFGTSCSGNLSNETYVLSHANGAGGTPAWTKLATNNKPTSRQQAAMVYNPGSNRITVFGGLSNNTGFLNDAWVLTNANGTGGLPIWTKLTPSKTAAPNPGMPTLAPRFQCSGLDTANDRMIITGVGNSNFDGPMWSTWVLSDADNQ